MLRLDSLGYAAASGMSEGLASPVLAELQEVV